MMGKKASNDTPHPVALLELWVGGGAKAFALNWRTIPETARVSGMASIRSLPGVRMPCQPLKLTRKPALPSGTPESRCTGRTAAAASSTVTAPSGLNSRETRSCGLRENS